MKSVTRNRLSTASRVIAGTLGAYGVTSLATAALARLLAWLGMDRVEAVLAATLASFALFCAIAMAAFHARSAFRVWLWLGLSAAPCAMVLMLLTFPKGQ